jgi:hypothetical protein
MSVEEFKDLVRDIVSQELNDEQPAAAEEEEEMPTDDMEGVEGEEIDINELLSELAEEEVEEEINIDELLSELGEMEDKTGYDPDNEEWEAEDDHPGQTKYVSRRDIEESKTQLAEALKTVTELRTQLQEVNLLNAKLLYVNKVFKANNLTESQKVNVVAAFDRAETVREVKLVFETVSKNVINKPVAIKEHRSFASKPVGTSKTGGKTEIISEVSETVKRMQKLAGII